MERLTSRNEDCVSVNGYGLYHLTMTEVVQMADRLADYEDTGLTPEEIKAPFTEDTMINLAAQALGVEPSRLRELAEADKDGRVLILPCKLGTKVYRIRYKIVDYPGKPEPEITTTWFTPDFRVDIGSTVLSTSD